MLEDDEVSDFLDRNDDLGWEYWIGSSGGFGWGRVEGMGPYKSVEEAAAAAKQKFVYDKIQPRNTIGPEQQRGVLLDGVNQAIKDAADGNDPVGGAAKVRLALDNLRQWTAKLNTDKTFRAVNKVEGADTVGNPEGSKAKSIEDQTTADFAKESVAIYNAYDAAVSSGDPDAVAGMALPPGLDNLRGSLQEAALLSKTITGFATGDTAFVLDAQGLHAVPTALDLSGNKVPVDSSGNVMSNAVQVPTTVNGKTVMAFANPTTQKVWNGDDIYDLSGNLLAKHGEALTSEDESQLKDMAANGQLRDLVSSKAVDAGGGNH